MVNGLISVIVPVYKAEKYLDACVSSIRSQSYTNLEIILVNDGSPDGCGDMCDAFALRDDRVRVIHKSNGGVASALNAGLGIANGEFVAFVGSDDTVDADMYMHLHTRIEETGADICVCGYKRIYDGYSRIVRVPYERKVEPPEVWELFISNTRIYLELFVTPCNKLIRSDILSINGNEPDILFPEGLKNTEDGWFVADCIKAAKNGVVFDASAPYNYFQNLNPQSLSKSSVYENLNNLLLRIKDIIVQELPDKTAGADKAVNCQICVNVVYAMHIAIVNGYKPPNKLKWNIVATILKDSNSREEKLSALLMYFLPSKLYTAAYKLHSKASISN